MTRYLRNSIEIISSKLPSFNNVLEIGSRQEKNQRRITNLRNSFKYDEFIGIDFRKGPGVDRVINAEKLPFKNNQFDLILCLETLEHTKRPWKIAQEIIRTLSINGIVLISSQQNYPLHKHPSDYFRFTPYGLSNLFEKLNDKLIVNISPTYLDELRLNPQLILLIGFKRQNRKLKEILKNTLINNKKFISGHKPYRHRLFDAFKFIRRAINEFTYKQDLLFIDD